MPSASATSPSSHSRVKTQNTRAPSSTRSGSASPRDDGDQPRAGAAPHSPTMSSGRTGTRVSGAPVAERSAATIAGVEEIVGGSPTPRSP